MIVHAKFISETKPKSLYMQAVRVMTTAICAVCLLSATSLIAPAQETSTLLVLRPRPKASDADKITSVAPVVESSIIAPIVQSDVFEIRIGGKPATITS